MLQIELRGSSMMTTNRFGIESDPIVWLIGRQLSSRCNFVFIDLPLTDVEPSKNRSLGAGSGRA